MGLPERKWFGLENLAKRWNVPKSLIDDYILSGFLEVSYLVDAKWKGKEYWTKMYPPTVGNHYYYKTYISFDEVCRFEKKHGINNEEPLNAHQAPHTKATSAQPYLDTQHKHYSAELAVAVKTWLGVCRP